MEEKLVTLAIHKIIKAHILKNVLEAHGIEVFFEEIEDSPNKNNPSGIIVKIKESELTRALNIIEENKLFNYSDQQIFHIDDGRKRILVPVDFSDYSLNACNFAFNIAKKMDAKVKILHVFRQMHFPSTMPFADALEEEGDESMLDKARKKVLSLCNEIDKKITNNELPSVNYSYALREGIAEEEIEAFIDEYKPSLIVIGTKGKNQAHTQIIGSVTAELIDTTNVPILAVPENTHFKNAEDLHHLAFITNFQRHDFISFNALAQFLAVFKNVKITLIHLNVINKKGEKWSEAQIQEKRDYFSSQYPYLDISYKLVDASDIVQGVNNLIDLEVDIVALNSRKKTLLGRIFTKSITQDIVFNTNFVILILRE